MAIKTRGGVSLSSVVEGRVYASCERTLSYLASSGVTIYGLSYGSDRFSDIEEAGEVLANLVRRLHFETYGQHLLTKSTRQIVGIYRTARKANFKRCPGKSRDGTQRMFTPFVKEMDSFPLIDGDDDSYSATVYAYYGRVATFPQRLVKIGYTTQELRRYLSSKRIPHKPQLLATRPGGRNAEDLEKAKWSLYLREGNEWFEPSRTMFRYFEQDDMWQTDSMYGMRVTQIASEWGL